MDGTLADSHSKWLEIARERYGIHAEKKDLVVYDFWELLGLENEEACLDIFREAWKDYRDIPPLSYDVSEIVGKLRNTYEVCINTACVGKPDEVRSWLKYNRIAYDSFHFCKTKEEKFSVKSALHVDDSAELAEKFALGGNDVVLISQPWNRALIGKLAAYGNITVASNWSDVLEISQKRGF